MLTFITAAPDFVLRAVLGLGHGAYADAPFDSPRWAESTVTVPEHEAFAVLMALEDWRTEAWHPERRAMRVDPVFALAAAAIERERNEGGTPAPAMLGWHCAS